jgi:D-arabinose 1-dehydrogenase-like Zn-dependent alcohol dehydrogenase
MTGRETGRTSIPVKTVTTGFALGAANEALRRVREGKLEGAAVLVP